jgi:hypothetical protein
LRLRRRAGRPARQQQAAGAPAPIRLLEVPHAQLSSEDLPVKRTWSMPDRLLAINRLLSMQLGYSIARVGQKM